MGWQLPLGMDLYLAPTELCDCASLPVREKALELVSETTTPTQAAQAIFSYVRDAIPFNATMDVWQRASQTLGKRVCDYCTKINLHMALLRAAGIPARCHYARVRKEALRSHIPKLLYDRLPSPVGHLWCECQLAGAWIACEALFDEPFYRGILNGGWVTAEQIPTIDWNGDDDLILLESWIVRDIGTFPSFDALLRSPFFHEEGMPPKLFCKLIDPLSALASSRRTNQVRQNR